MFKSILFFCQLLEKVSYGIKCTEFGLNYAFKGNTHKPSLNQSNFDYVSTCFDCDRRLNSMIWLFIIIYQEISFFIFILPILLNYWWFSAFLTVLVDYVNCVCEYYRCDLGKAHCRNNVTNQLHDGPCALGPTSTTRSPEEVLHGSEVNYYFQLKIKFWETCCFCLRRLSVRPPELTYGYLCG
jgi:hypothetical protein